MQPSQDNPALRQHAVQRPGGGEGREGARGLTPGLSEGLLWESWERTPRPSSQSPELPSQRALLSAHPILSRAPRLLLTVMLEGGP